MSNLKTTRRKTLHHKRESTERKGISVYEHVKKREWKERNLKKKLSDVYTYDIIPGKYHYRGSFPSYYTWDNWMKLEPEDIQHDFGKHRSPQAAKKAFLEKFPVENNYYLWISTGKRLFRNGQAIMFVGNDMIRRK